MNFNTTTTNPEFEARLEEARTKSTTTLNGTRLSSEVAINDALRRESISTMTAILNRTNDVCGFDQDKLNNQIKAIRKSEYGKVPAMMNIFTKLYAWPITEGGDAKEITSIQFEIRESLAEIGIVIDEDLILDHREAKGYHSFFDDRNDYEIIPANEPDFEEYEYYTLTMAEKFGLPFVDNKLNETKWLRLESKELAKAKQKFNVAQAELENHRALEEA